MEFSSSSIKKIVSKRQIKSVFFQFLEALKFSWVSILVILIILVLMTQMDQGVTIFVDILDGNGLNFILFYALIVSLSFVISHYPIYFEKRKNWDSSKEKWEMYPKNGVFRSGLGFISYSYNSSTENSSDNFLIFSILRKFFGLILISIIIYLGWRIQYGAITQINDGFINKQPSTCGFLIILGVISIPHLIFAAIHQKNRLANFKDFKGNKIENSINNIGFSLFMLSLLACLILVLSYGWSEKTYFSFQICNLCLALYYTAFRNFRKNSLFANDFLYLIFLSLGAIGSSAILLIAHFEYDLFNPFVILLAQLHVIYAIIVVPKKHYLYYLNHPEKNYITARYFRKIHPYTFYILCVILFFADFQGNDLHLIEKIKRPELAEKKELDLSTFAKEIDSMFTEKDTVFFISSYGGGMKASIWTSLILDTLTNFDGKKNIIEHTVSMSGVSGGALGQSLFTALKYTNDSTVLKPRILDIGKTNMVSADLTYLLGRDLLFEFIPGFMFKPFAKYGDREDLAMKRHASFVSDSRLTLHTFQSLWAELFWSKRKKNGFFPALIANSAGTHTERGIGSSIIFSDSEFKNIFHNSTYINNYEGNESLPYFYPASIANRFPIFSPAAKIKSKGHFIDGGYFENSGMLSNDDFYQALKVKSKVISKCKVFFIQISNGKDEYIRSLLKKQTIKKEVKESPEFSSILSTISSISFVPNYLSDKYADSTNYIQLHLPYFITDADINKLVSGKAEISKDDLRQINQSNAYLKNLIGKDSYRYIQPPLARMLGTQSINYMNIIIKDGLLFKELKEKLK
jgi:hypothetical protein